MLIFFPGQGQMVQDDNPLTRELADLVQFDQVWGLDLNPLEAGDVLKARAIRPIVENCLGTGELFRLTLIGWSHGAAEALLAAEQEPAIVDKVIAICPSGFLDISLHRIISGFALECVFIFFRALPTGKLQHVLKLGLSISLGMVKDLIKSSSLKTFLQDIRWAGRRVVGEDYTFSGKVTIILGRRDSLMQPKRILPDYANEETGQYVNPVFKQKYFPRAQELRVFVTDNDHAGPVINPDEFIRLGLG